ncbi:MAG: 2-5 ligase [Rhizorhabdus sp.]|nr:2-5 ligase [Rhizorhabdus sp.]
MFRLFVALRPPLPMRQALLAIMGGFERARWQSDDQLHLTLRFIGEVDRHQAADIAAALGGIYHPAFALKLDGLGCFDKKGRIDSLWAGVTPHDAIRSLHERIDRALRRVGVAPDGRAFLPHITIARFARASAPIAPLSADLTMPPPIEARFDHFHLYESDLGATGSTYSIIQRYPLT